MQRIPWWRLSVGVVLHWSCATMTIVTEHAPDAGFAHLTAYDWAPELGVSDPRVDTVRVARSIKAAIETVLGERGYDHRVADPDFVIDYHAVVEHKTIEAVARSHRPADELDLVSMGPDTRYCRELDEGTLVVDFLDPASGRVLWRGLARDEVDWRMSPTEIDQRIRDAVRRILERFPPN